MRKAFSFVYRAELGNVWWSMNMIMFFLEFVAVGWL